MNWVWGFNLLNNNVNAMQLARTYWGINAFVLPDWGPILPSLSAWGLRGSGWYWPPISQDSDGIPQHIHARCMVFLHWCWSIFTFSLLVFNSKILSHSSLLDFERVSKCLKGEENPNIPNNPNSARLKRHIFTEPCLIDPNDLPEPRVTAAVVGTIGAFMMLMTPPSQPLTPGVAPPSSPQPGTPGGGIPPTAFSNPNLGYKVN